MTFAEAFKKLLEAGVEIEAVANCDYLWETENGTYTEEEVIAFAESI